MDNQQLLQAALEYLGETEPPWDYRIRTDEIGIITHVGQKHVVPKRMAAAFGRVCDAVDEHIVDSLREYGLLENLCTVSESELLQVPGIGPVTARKIQEAVGG